MDGLNLNWGNVTPEGYEDATKEALHVLNVNFIGEENRSRALKFICARVLHFHLHLPKNSSQRVRFDLRGQLVRSKNLEHVRNAIINEATRHGILVTVEFLTN